MSLIIINDEASSQLGNLSVTHLHHWLKPLVTKTAEVMTKMTSRQATIESKKADRKELNNKMLVS